MSQTIPPEDIVQRIKALIPFRELFEELFPELYRPHGNSFCPFHEDHTPSLELKDNVGLCYGECSGSDRVKRYDIFDIYRENTGVDFQTAKDELASRYGLKTGSTSSQRWTLLAEYDYTDESGTLLFQVLRYAPKEFRQRRPNGNGGWIWSLGSTRRVLYRLPEILSCPMTSAVWLCEGEKAVDTLGKLGLVATCSPGGANKFRKLCKEFSIQRPLEKRRVFIIPDNDNPGRKDAEAKAEILHGCAGEVRIVTLPGLPEKGDAHDFVGEHGLQASRELLMKLAEKARIYIPNQKEHASEERAKPARETRFKKLTDLLSESEVDFFHDQFDKPWASLKVGGHRENTPIRSEGFRTYLLKTYYDATGEGCGRHTIQQIQDNCTAKARFEGDQRPLSYRLAWVDGRILIDLGTKDWSAIAVSESGWNIEKPVRSPFKRFKHTKALPLPTSGGSVQEVLQFLPLKDESARILISVWLPSILVPDIPRPGLILHGLHGSGKTYTSGILRDLVDPTGAPALSLPKDVTELVRILDHHALPIFDNISSLPLWASDLLCRAVTGCGFSKRELFTDDDDVFYYFYRPFILNGISLCATQPDLLDRSLIIELERISPQLRRSERELATAFAQARPRVFGAMLDALSFAMRNKGRIRLQELPRLADWTEWAIPIAEAIGESAQLFWSAFNGNIERQHMEINQSEPAAVALFAFMKDREEWIGTPTDLYKELFPLARDLSLDREKHWPRAANALTRKLNALGNNLLSAGIQYREDSKTKPKRILLRRHNLSRKIPGNIEKAGTPGKPFDPTASEVSVSGTDNQVPSNHSGKEPQHNTFPGVTVVGDANTGANIGKANLLTRHSNLEVRDVLDNSRTCFGAAIPGSDPETPAGQFSICSSGEKPAEGEGCTNRCLVSDCQACRTNVSPDPPSEEISRQARGTGTHDEPPSQT